MNSLKHTQKRIIEKYLEDEDFKRISSQLKDLKEYEARISSEVKLIKHKIENLKMQLKKVKRKYQREINVEFRKDSVYVSSFPKSLR
jgi:predicted  nucleic acid-binding Zn-ribbon protein